MVSCLVNSKVCWKPTVKEVEAAPNIGKPASTYVECVRENTEDEVKEKELDF